MASNQPIIFEDGDLVRQTMHLDQPIAGHIGHRLIVTTDAHQALVTDPALELENHAKRDQR